MHREARLECMEVVQASFWMDDLITDEGSIQSIFIFTMDDLHGQAWSWFVL